MCQDFVLECLETMYEGDVIEAYVYLEAKEELEGIYNQ